MPKKEKLCAPIGVRLAPTLAARLVGHAGERGEEEIEIIRRAIANEMDRLDALVPDSTRAQLNRLHVAGLCLEEVVQDAIERKAAEDAQLRLAGVESAAMGSGR